MSENASTEFGNELPVGYRLEEFEIKSVLGAGGFGITYLATDVDLKRDVVVKENLPFQCAVRDGTRSVRPRTTTPDDKDQFEWALNSFMREAETLSQFDHPNIVRILRRFEANNTAYFVMPYLPGQSLKQVIEQQVAKGEAFTESKLKDLLNPLLDALQALHVAGVYHRDIKAANILLAKGHRPILIDFGAARQVISAHSHTVVESAGYTPFEQLQSRGNVGPWSDIYAMAATFYTAIHGEAPPRASDRIRRDPIVKLADHYSEVYSRPFLEAIDWGLMVDEADRPQTIEAWRAALNGAAPAVIANVPPVIIEPHKKPAPLTPQTVNPVPHPVPHPFPVALVAGLAGAAAAALLLLALAIHLLAPLLAKPGSLVVNSPTPGATVHIPGQSDISVPANFPDLRAGSHQVTVSAPGFDPSSFAVQIKAGEMYPLQPVELKRSTGTLSLQTFPPRATYQLIESDDPNARSLHGTAPAELPNLPAGPYRLTLASSGLGSHTLNFDLPANQTTKETADLVQLGVVGDATSPAAKALLGQFPVDQLDDRQKGDYSSLSQTVILAYLRYHMFAQATAQEDSLHKMGVDTQALDQQIAQARNSFEETTSGQISTLITDGRPGAADSRLTLVSETLLPDQAEQLAAKFQPQLDGYRQQEADAIRQAQAGDPATGYDQLSHFGDAHPDAVKVQLALGTLLTQMPPDRDRLGTRLNVYRNFNQQYLGSAEASQFQAMQVHLQNELDTYNALEAKLSQGKGSPQALAHRISALQNEIAENQRKLEAGASVDNAVNAVTGLFGQRVHVTSAAERRAAIDREQVDLNQDLAVQQNAQGDTSGAQADFDAFRTKVPW